MLSKLRTKLNLSQQSMADILEMRQGTYCKYEHGILPMSLKIVKILRKKFKLNINKIIDNDEF